MDVLKKGLFYVGTYSSSSSWAGALPMLLHASSHYIHSRVCKHIISYIVDMARWQILETYHNSTDKPVGSRTFQLFFSKMALGVFPGRRSEVTRSFIFSMLTFPSPPKVATFLFHSLLVLVMYEMAHFYNLLSLDGHAAANQEYLARS